MNILILGAAGFIGTNLFLELSKNKDYHLTLVDKSRDFFSQEIKKTNAIILDSCLDVDMDFTILKDQDVVFHLVSSVIPTNSNQHITQDIKTNVVFSSALFDECVRFGVKKVIFISSGGTVYGKDVVCPISEDMETNPITSYGIQKLTIEKLLFLYNYMYGLDYRVIRLSNPYGPFQRPNGLLGAVTTFTYNALHGLPIIVYGDGSVVRDFIYIDDVIKGIINIFVNDSKYKVFNLGAGYGTSISNLIETVGSALSCKLNLVYKDPRPVDVPINYLNINRYEQEFGKLNPLSLRDGVRRLAEFFLNKEKN